MLKIQSLASGSRGNCTYISSGNTAILVDVGIGPRTIAARLNEAKINPLSINGILITHEHSDHIKGVAQFATRYGCNVYIHNDAADCFARTGQIDSDYIETFAAPFQIGDIDVSFFPVLHDSEHCYGYTFEKDYAKISVATDIGVITKEVLDGLSGSQIVLLESNHDPIRLRANTKYPEWLKNRIKSNRGHLSNKECCETVIQLMQTGLQQVILAHLSAENNSPTLAYSCICDFMRERGIIEGKDIYVDIAEQDKISTTFQID